MTVSQVRLASAEGVARGINSILPTIEMNTKITIMVAERYTDEFQTPNSEF